MGKLSNASTAIIELDEIKPKFKTFKLKAIEMAEILSYCSAEAPAFDWTGSFSQ